jgi:hypothetical protein
MSDPTSALRGNNVEALRPSAVPVVHSMIVGTPGGSSVSKRANTGIRSLLATQPRQDRWSHIARASHPEALHAIGRVPKALCRRILNEQSTQHERIRDARAQVDGCVDINLSFTNHIRKAHDNTTHQVARNAFNIVVGSREDLAVRSFPNQRQTLLLGYHVRVYQRYSCSIIAMREDKFRPRSALLRLAVSRG